MSLVCPVCSGKFEKDNCRKVEYPFNSADNKISSKPNLICFCNKCEAGIAVPTLTDEQLVNLYSQGNFWKNSEIKALLPRMFPGHYALAQVRWNYVEAFIKKNKQEKEVSILDIGAGQGFFGIVALKSPNIFLKKYSAVEKDSALRKSLEKTWCKHFPKIKFEAKDSLEEIQGKYNLIILSNILEHLNDPKDMLKRATEKLTKDGFLFVDVPNQDYLFKKDVFPHLLFFNRISLKTLLTESGLAAKSIDCYGRNMVYSPINYRNNKKMFVKISALLYKMRFIIPLQISKAFFIWYFGSDKKNANGTWLRALSQRKISNK